MRQSPFPISWIYLAALTAMGLVFMVAPPVLPAAPETSLELASQPRTGRVESLPEAQDALLPAVALRRVWSGFELVPAADQVTPLHFEVLEDGHLGWGPTWKGQVLVEPHGERIKVRLHEGRSSADLVPLRALLARAGMMAPDAALGEER